VDIYRISEVAELLGTSADTVRRWVDEGKLGAERTPAGHRRISGPDLARFVTESAPLLDSVHPLSARNRIPGIVTRVETDKVTAKVEIRAGRYRLVSIVTTEAVEELGLEPGVMVFAVVKATNVMVERRD
jgi:molybdopterin-binding protein